VVAVSLLGWFGIQNAIFARSLTFALQDKISFVWAATLTGVFLTIIVAFGFKALRFTARIAVPLFILLVAFITVTTLSGVDLRQIMGMLPADESVTLSAGITMVVGGAIVASLITLDLIRYSKNGKQVLGITLLTIIAGEFIVNGLAILIAKILGSADVVTIMSQTAGGIGLLGVVFPPIISIMLVDYYLLRSHRKVLDDSRKIGTLPVETPVIGWSAIIASIIGSIIGLSTSWGVPTINSLISAGIIYWLVKKIIRTH